MICLLLTCSSLLPRPWCSSYWHLGWRCYSGQRRSQVWARCGHDNTGPCTRVQWCQSPDHESQWHGEQHFQLSCCHWDSVSSYSRVLPVSQDVTWWHNSEGCEYCHNLSEGSCLTMNMSISSLRTLPVQLQDIEVQNTFSMQLLESLPTKSLRWKCSTRQCLPWTSWSTTSCALTPITSLMSSPTKLVTLTPRTPTGHLTPWFHMNVALEEPLTLVMVLPITTKNFCVTGKALGSPSKTFGTANVSIKCIVWMMPDKSVNVTTFRDSLPRAIYPTTC